MSKTDIDPSTSDYAKAITQQIREMVRACETGQSESYKNLYDHCMVWAIMVPEAVVEALRQLSDEMESSPGLRQIYADQLQYFGDWPYARLLHANNPSPLVRAWSDASQDAINLLAIPGSGEDFLASTLINYLALTAGDGATCKPINQWLDKIVSGDRFTYLGDGELAALNNRLEFNDLPFSYFMHHQQCSAAAIMGPKRIFLYRNPLDSYTAQYQRMMAQSFTGIAAEQFVLEDLPLAELDDVNDFAVHFIFTTRCLLMQREDESETAPQFLCFEDLISEPFDNIAELIDYLELEFNADNLEQAVEFSLQEMQRPDDGTPPWNVDIGAWKSGMKSLDAFRTLETMSGAGIDIDHFEYDPRVES